MHLCLIFLLLWGTIAWAEETPTRAEIEARIAATQAQLSAQYGNMERGQLLLENARLQIPGLQKTLEELKQQLQAAPAAPAS